MKILAIHDGHNASAAFLQDGEVIAAIQEERLTRNKNQGGFPENSILEILKIANCNLKDVDHIAFCGFGVINHKTRDDVIGSYEKKFNAKPDNIYKKAEKQIRLLRDSLFPGLKKRKRKKHLEKKQSQRMLPLLQQGVDKQKIHFIDHHLCHAATAYYGQNNMKDKILVLTCDGAGDYLSASVRIGQNGMLEKLGDVAQEDSVPILYSFVTYLLGFAPLEHEYKLMGLAPYAKGGRQSQEICDYFKSLFRFTKDKPLGWVRNKGVPSTFEMGPVLKDVLQYKRFDQIAGGLQAFIEEFFVEWIERVIDVTGVHKIALAGGLFMNVKLNKKIMEMPKVESLYVFPSCGDESISIGAGWAAHVEFSKEGNSIPPLGPTYWSAEYSSKDVDTAIDQYNFTKKIKIEPIDDIEKRCAQLLAKGQIVARCKGKMEFGARALGNRSILADPGSWQTIHIINAMIKQRDFWMPFAPSMLAEYADDYIINPKGIKAPHMILSFDSKKEILPEIIAAVHPYDGSCRPQVVEKETNPDYHRLIDNYRELTGKAVVLNTSFNLHGFPVVYSPKDALDVFDKSGLKYLALENVLVQEIE
ncbi:MAG: hypothetical protein KAI40_07705 [Desulfobacterales bacterium]|nr:hypothetical protein [Desulfobacterales bacterium]